MDNQRLRLRDGSCKQLLEAKAKKGVPKLDGTGEGKRLNKNRGGCNTPKKTGRGRAGSKRTARPGRGRK